MFARKKIEQVEPIPSEHLRSQIESANVENHRQAMRKDIHLLELAMATDEIVASLDEAAKNHFQNYCSNVRSIQKICWINPAMDADSVLEWLEAGALANQVQSLGG